MHPARDTNDFVYTQSLGRACDAGRSARPRNFQLHMRRIQRPVGVHVMAAYDFLVVGVIPLLTFVLALRNSGEEYPFLLVLVSVALYFCVMGAAVWAWSGDNTGRWVLLAVVTFVALQWI